MLKFDKRVERFRELLAEKISGNAELPNNPEHSTINGRKSGLN